MCLFLVEENLIFDLENENKAEEINTNEEKDEIRRGEEEEWRRGEEEEWRPEMVENDVNEMMEKRGETTENGLKSINPQENDKIMMDILYNIYFKHPQLMTR